MIKIEHSDNDVDYRFVLDNLAAYNKSQTGPLPPSPKETLLLVSEDGVRHGGLVYNIRGKCFDIDLLWLAEDTRGQGLGSALIREAIERAKQAGCTYIWVGTSTFQAPLFYPKFGFKTVVAREDYPFAGNTHYQFRLDLV